MTDQPAPRRVQVSMTPEQAGQLVAWITGQIEDAHDARLAVPAVALELLAALTEVAAAADLMPGEQAAPMA